MFKMPTKWPKRCLKYRLDIKILHFLVLPTDVQIADKMAELAEKCRL